jgi:hypothetical protein
VGCGAGPVSSSSSSSWVRLQQRQCQVCEDLCAIVKQQLHQLQQQWFCQGAAAEAAVLAYSVVRMRACCDSPCGCVTGTCVRTYVRNRHTGGLLAMACLVTSDTCLSSHVSRACCMVSSCFGCEATAAAALCTHCFASFCLGEVWRMASQL